MTPRHILPASPEALFRFQVVSAVLAAIARDYSQADAVETVGSQAHPTLSGAMTTPSVRSVYRWLAAFRARGMAGLEPTPRERCADSVVLPANFLNFIVDQKDKDPRASIPELIKRTRQLGIIAPDARIDRVTVWRAARRLVLETTRRKRPKQADVRKFAYAHRNQMILADGKHFRAGAHRLRRVALFFIDDATRFVTHAVVGTAESKELFLRGLYEMIRRSGFSDGVYLDRGPGFRALDTGLAVQATGALWILGTAGYPPGRGKIEKFNQTIQEAVLRFLAAPGVDADCGALELRLQHYIREIYNHEPHESLDGATPWQRWSTDTRPLRMPEDDADLRRRFVASERRRVSIDNTLPMEGVDYEVPLGHAGEWLMVQRLVLDDTLSIVHDGRLVRLFPVDLTANATSGRATRRPEAASTAPLPPSAAELAFRRDLQPIVGPDGGFAEPKPEEP